MRIAVFGLGYVGTVTGACLAKEGNTVIGVDINKDKVKAINKAKSPVIEKALEKIISLTVKNGYFSALSSAKKAILKTDMAMICVGTPSMESGSIDIGHLRTVIGGIGEVLSSLVLGDVRKSPWRTYGETTRCFRQSGRGFPQGLRALVPDVFIKASVSVNAGLRRIIRAASSLALFRFAKRPESSAFFLWREPFNHEPAN